MKVYDYIFELNDREFKVVGVLSKENDYTALRRVWKYIEDKDIMRNQLLVKKEEIGDYDVTDKT